MMSLAEYRRTAARLADYLPWVALVGEGVVLNKDGSFSLSVLKKVGGRCLRCYYDYGASAGELKAAVYSTGA